jgi:outer membrane lipoprotein-sorting protein
VHQPVDAELPEPSRVLEQLREAGKKRGNLRALGRLTYFGEKGRVRLKAVLVVERPDRFRFETVSPLEQPVDVMACDGKQLWLLSKEKLFVGAATPDNVARLLPLPMNPEEVVDTLLGGVPTSARFKPVEVTYDGDDRERLALILEGSEGERARVLIDREKTQVLSMALLERGGDVRVSVTFEDFESAGDAAGDIPRTIALKMPARDLEVDIRLKEVDVNVPLNAELFRIEAPPGVVPEPLAPSTAAR